MSPVDYLMVGAIVAGLCALVAAALSYAVCTLIDGPAGS